MAPPSVTSSQKSNAHGNNAALEQRIGLATSVIMPLLELGAMGFVSWVLVFLIGVQYLIDPSEDLRLGFNVQPRRGTGIALIIVYAILLLLLLVPWLRLLQVIWSKQDLVPLGDPSREKMDMSTKAFDKYDAFICDFEGMPLWCNKCHNFKPDRTHHCKELGRCVRKMDHYCPWAGGIIAESTHKFFLQFVFFAALYTAYVWIVVAVFFGDRISKVGSRPGTWIGALAVTAVFFVFTFTMTGMTGWNLMINFTSVEGIQRGGIHNIAFLISRSSREPISPPTSSPRSRKERKSSDFEEDWPVLCTVQRGAGRTSVVMQTKTLEHPWYTTLMTGWKDTMGNSFIDWILPFRQSPCKQRSHRGEFEWGEVVYDMAKKYEADNPGTRLALLEGER
ncbi:palmitoyltransferase PFA5 [Cucurbitaria berberidis CBS 394.84]|uniref:Palmitoyltransferase n=1 Tax=Cucurbitaria berberidis CBS 394.84 TaxID=1168544 RepID=A0A9P4LB48_9PLEO|nr:palmitoyltransferase PFA5 [Cucurbitaria berberidis CBS 394.84]KAF1849171.1 palmitoyltransferase PFA5 [Cucurbitaria berberidis CBS 394.84]